MVYVGLVISVLAPLAFAAPRYPEVNYWFSLWVLFLFVSHTVFLIRDPSSSGDSYTQTGFEFNGTQPSIGNPLGNPPYPVCTPFLTIQRHWADVRLGLDGYRWTKLDRH